MRKWSIAAALILGFALGALAHYPFISPASELSEAQLEAVLDQAKGLYSHRLPLIPYLIKIDHIPGEAVYYTIYYFPFGTVGMS